MGMNINSNGYLPNLNHGSYGAYEQKLTTLTKQKLIENNIPFNDKTSEKEGQRLLSEALKKNKTNTERIASGNDRDSQDPLRKRVESLALKVGVKVKPGEDLKKVLNEIEENLKEKLKESGNDIGTVLELRGLSLELAGLQGELNGSSGYDNTNQPLIASLEMLSQYNKNFMNYGN